MGTVYREFLVEQIANGVKGNADLCSYFFLRADQSLRVNGGMGLIATNTIAQGDTREVGLDRLVAKGLIIPRAVPSRKWPGSANLEVAHVWMKKGQWKGVFEIDDKPVGGITPYLTKPGKIVGNPYRLLANKDKSFIGSFTRGTGFLLTNDEYSKLIQINPKNSEVIFPYLTGEDLNSRPDQSPSRYVINFSDWPLSKENNSENPPNGQPYASDYPDCLEIVEARVKADRLSLPDNPSNKDHKERWWQFGRIRPALYGAIEGCDRVLTIPLVSKHFICAWEPAGLVYSHALGVVASDKDSMFALLQNTIHDHWARSQGSTLETRMRYTPSDCFETFPFPTNYNNLETIGEAYYTHRQSIMLTRQEGLTKTYNRFHNPEDTAEDIAILCNLHIEMDTAVAAAYGWQDLTLDHGFHETKQGLRFTISEAARREVLDRLLALNHERYAEEVKLGLHDKKNKKGKKANAKNAVAKEESPLGEQIKLFF